MHKLFEVQRVSGNFDLITSEQYNASVFIICSGSVKVVHGHGAQADRILNILGNGEILGEMSVIEDAPASATVTTLEPCHLLCIEGERFRRALLQFPRISFNLLAAQNQRIRLLSRRVETIANPSVRCRVADQLLAFAQSYGRPVCKERPVAGKDILLPLRLRQKDLANLIGASREQVNRTLSSFQTEGYLSIGPHQRFTLHDMQGLFGCCA